MDQRELSLKKGLGRSYLGAGRELAQVLNLMKDNPALSSLCLRRNKLLQGCIKIQ